MSLQTWILCVGATQPLGLYAVPSPIPGSMRWGHSVHSVHAYTLGHSVHSVQQRDEQEEEQQKQDLILHQKLFEDLGGGGWDGSVPHPRSVLMLLYLPPFPLFIQYRNGGSGGRCSSASAQTASGWSHRPSPPPPYSNSFWCKQIRPSFLFLFLVYASDICQPYEYDILIAT